MTRTAFKKTARTRFEGRCYGIGGGRWVETVATKKEANKRFRKATKVVV